MLKKIREISDDLVFYGSTGSPKLLVEDIKITGN
jgi:predicted Zn-dependent protease